MTVTNQELHARVERDTDRIMAAIRLRTFTFVSASTGQEMTFTCMPGCVIDHSGDAGRAVHPHDIYCRADGATTELPLYGPLCESSGPEEFLFLGWQINVEPFARKLGRRLPHMNIEAVNDHWIEDLDPDALASVIDQVQQQVDSLRAAHAQLVAVRAQYASARDAQIGVTA